MPSPAPHRRPTRIDPILRPARPPLLLRLCAFLYFVVFSVAQTTSSSTNAPCTPNSGYHGVCSRLGVTYPISLAPGAANTTEAAVLTSGVQFGLLRVRLVNFQCGAALQTLSCSQTFPKCGLTSVSPMFNVEQRTCKSSCQRAVNICRPVFATSQIDMPLPDCDAPTDATYGRLAPFFDDTDPASKGTCVDSDALVASNPLTTTCTFPFVANPYWPDRVAPTVNCNGPCCAPCPIGEIFAPPGLFHQQIVTHQVLHFVAFLLSLFVVISYSVLPGRRDHPADIVLHFAIATCIWMAVSMWTLPNVKAIQCAADGVTPSTAFNNKLCGLQAAWLLVGVHASVLWGAYMIWNLHTTIVWKSNLLARYKPFGIIVCWGVPILLTTITLGADTVDASTGPICFISSTAAVKYVFGIQGAVMFPTVVANMWTFIHIARVAHLAGGNNNSAATGSALSGGSYELDSSGNKVAKAVNRRRQFAQLVSMNWRALLLGVVFVSTYVTYFSFYSSLTAVTSSATPDQPWVVDFFECLTLNPRGQTMCIARFADRLPSSTIISAAYITTGLVGVWIFIVFGVQTALIRDWASLIKDGTAKFEKKRSKV
ncbi:hypothetical protein HDU88_001865 [Geranomyces variabilis]|nr:hypothetical protein HDU88_001865 [Geranomyces variabilis]